MQYFVSVPSHAHAGQRLLAISLTTLMLGGCACDEQDWETMVAYPAEASETVPAPDCEAGDLALLSKTSAELAERADPQTLEIARLEAERDCYRAAEHRWRDRLK